MRAPGAARRAGVEALGCVAKRQGEMSLRLPMRAEPGGVLGCERRQPEQGGGIASSGGMVDQPCQVRRLLAAGPQRSQDAGVQLATSQRRQLILDGASSELMAKGDSAVVEGDNPRSQQVVEG